MKRYFPVIAFLAVAAAGIATALFAYIAAEEANRIKFEATADDALNRIESRVVVNLALLRATDAYFAARGGDVTAEEFREYFQTLKIDTNFAGLRGIGMIAMAPSGDAGLLEREIVRIQGARRDIYPAQTDAEWRTPIVLYEPLSRPISAGLGFDMFSDESRRDAILSAIDTGEPRATGRVLLGRATSSEVWPGFLIFSAVEMKRELPGRSQSILFASFRAQELFDKILEKFPALPIHAEVFDGPVAAENLLFRSEKPAFGNLVTTRQLLVAGRPWTIEFRPAAGFTRPTSQFVPVLLGVFGLLLALAIALLQRYQARAYEAVSELQENAEKSLLEKDLMLQEMKHRIKNSITRVLAISRQTAATSKNVSDFSESFAARLQAMAASQDMLTRSSWQKADLGELLRIELSQAFGKELPEGMLNGPKVLLSETATQALGLTFHELATNALKYGEVGRSPETLKVSWGLRQQQGVLWLSWLETGGKAVGEPDKLGFGTKLIDMNITRELNGRIKRTYAADGLKIEILIPLGEEKVTRAKTSRQRKSIPPAKAG